MAVAARRSAAPLVAVTIGLLIGVPIVVVLRYLGSETNGLWSHLASTVLPRYLRNTLWLVLGVSLLASLLGVSTAWLVTVCRFPGRSAFRWLLLLPLAVPSYLSAYAYTDLLQFSGPVQSALREAFGWGPREYWFPAVRSLGGAIVVLSLCLYPYVYLAARAAFVEQSVCTLEAGRTLGLNRWQTFRRLGLPLARPSIAAGLSLVLMETLAEFGAVQYFAVDTFATGIYRTFTLPNEYALVAASQLSACLLALVVLLLVLEQAARRAARFHHTSTRYRAQTTWELGGAASLGAMLACLFPVVFGFGVPFVLFLHKSWVYGDARARELFFEYGTNSFQVAALASLLAVFLAFSLAYSLRLRPTPLARAAARLAGVGYAVPGGVIAIGILVTLTWIDRRVSTASELLLGASTGLLLTGSLVAVVYGYQTRFLAVSLQLLQAGLSRIRPTLDEAGRTLGATPLQVLWRVHTPLLRSTLLAAGILVFVDVIKELPATLILRPFGYETLAVRVYQLASDERLSEASTGALGILMLGMVPVVFLARTLDRRRPGQSLDDLSE
ncbi:MAG: iron ABC transporter permease [Acidobacteriota bacterium]